MSTESPTLNDPQVSIICRTLGRPELQQALNSIAAQDYPEIEIVLVDAAGTNTLEYEKAAGTRPVQLVSTGNRLSRSAAANAGLEASRGKYIQFLDDDDWLAPNHVSLLVSVLEGDAEIGAAYGSTQKTNAAGDELGYVFEEDFDPILLMRDNYIPIHAILFEGALLKQGCRFDEAFDIYEDWDFWLQLSEHTRFHHVDEITAFYREGGDSDTAAADVRQRYEPEGLLGRARAALFDKWLPKWDGEKLNALIGHLDQSLLLTELNERIHTELQRNDALQHEIELRNIALSEKDAELEHLRSHGERQATHVRELEQRLNAIYASPSWKLMGPVRRVGRALQLNKDSSSDQSGSDK